MNGTYRYYAKYPKHHAISSELISRMDAVCLVGEEMMDFAERKAQDGDRSFVADVIDEPRGGCHSILVIAD